ncbi:GRB2-associated-binding protein 3 isoform X3 [Bos javanicus]|uniref:GRB2-associated-binding protein 3 isoform X3 n=1 Tax=Bos javanicus TaxID=9906 RepID=UPI002AA6CE8A|nr:GRB2-associated-binding protein 3 isoform X3 [Bos javanicus]
MSAGDTVCMGWLVKSPPERKLQRYAWRRRWFVLRRGRLSGDRDVLEYYRSQRASKPIRTIDLSECAVWKHAGPGFVRKEFQNHFVFIVKTTSRTFYLVAKTEEEMQVWVHSISQVCNLGHLEDRGADVEGQSLRHRDKRLSLNLPCRFFPMSPPTSTSTEDGYMPMSPQTATFALGPHDSSDDYIPMNSGSISSPLPELPVDLEPPPVNRDLKPQRKTRPPTLDLKNLSTIREHTCLTRTHTVPCNRTSFLSPERNGINSARFFANSVSREEGKSYIQMEERRATNSLSSGAVTWTKKFSLDYLALDFNSASPAPVQQKILLSEEQRVDYVQVDEQKTQALQSTKQEWTDERQSKV